MLSPNQSDIRKSLDSIQSMLSNTQTNNNNSPIIRTSLSSRIQRASMEGTNTTNYDSSNYNNEGGSNFGGGMMAPELLQQHQLGSGGMNNYSSNSLGNNQQQQRTSSVSFHSNNNNNLMSPTYHHQSLGGSSSLGANSLGGGSLGGQLGVSQLGGTSVFSPSHPHQQHNHQHQQQNQQGGMGTRDSLSYTPFEMENNNNLMLGGSGSADSGIVGTSSLLLGQQQQFGAGQQQQQLGSGQQHGVRGELSSGMGHQQQQQQQLGSNDIRSPSSAFTSVNNNMLNQQQQNFGGEESSPPFNMANVANGLERSSNMSSSAGGIGLSGIGGMAAGGMGRNSATGGSNTGSAEGGGRVMRKYQPRETSLLVSPIPQSDAFNNGGRGNSVDALGSAGSRSHVAVTQQQQQQYGPTGTPSTGLATTQQYSGRDPTPYHYRSNPSTSPSANNNNKKKTSSSGSSKESVASTTSSSRSGLDPPAKSPFPTSIHAHHTTSSSSIGNAHHQHQHHHVGNNSSSSLRTPNGMMMGRESSQQQGYTTGYATNKSTPNVNSHHYQHLMAVEQQQQQENNNNHQQVELSMIQEDTVADHGGMTVGNDEMSHVTGSTFVRTPNGVRKGQQYTPKNTSYYTTTPGSTTSATVIATAAAGNNNNDNTTSDDSPSTVMRRELDNLASQTSNTLDEIWDCVGVPHEERINQFHQLVEQFQVVFDAVINKEEGMRIQFTKEIDEARTEWKSICQALKLNEEDPVRKMKRDPSSKDVTSQTTLQVEYETLDLRLQALRKIKNVAMSDMEVSSGRICEAFAALNGCTVDEAHTSTELHSFMDIVSDLTDARREEFRSKALEYEESVDSRTKAIVSLIMDCQSMIRELEIEPPSMEAAVGCDEDDIKIMNSLSRADAGDDEVESSRDDQQPPQQLRRGNSNDYTIVDLFESSTCMGISTSSLDRLTTRIAELNGEKRRRRAKLAEMGATISSLWQMLRVPSEEQRAFTTSIRGLGLDTIRKGEAEIVRLEELKAVMIGKLVREQRDMIEELWDKTNSSVAERSSFNTYFHITNEERLTSDVLIKHEEYVSSLKAKLDKMQPILDLIAKRETIIDERSELEILQKDPDRLQGRGAAKQLAKEEKMSRRVTKELPKITGILEKTLRQWYVENKPNKEEEEEGQVVNPDLGHFMYQGIPYLQTMKHQDEEWRTRKERAEEERQRKREEERTASSAANGAFGYTNTYTKLPGKKTSYNSRPRSASNVRSGSSTSARSGSNLRSGGARPTSSSSTRSDRFGGRGPLGDVSSSKQNTSRPPSRPRGGGDHQGGKKVVAGGRGYRPASAPRMRL